MHKQTDKHRNVILGTSRVLIKLANLMHVSFSVVELAAFTVSCAEPWVGKYRLSQLKKWLLEIILKDMHTHTHTLGYEFLDHH